MPFKLRFRTKSILFLLALLAIITTWPISRDLFSRVPGSDTWAYDEYTFIWSMWWFKYSALDLHSSIFFSQNIFYPLGMELILYSYNLMAAILALPLGLVAGWPFASNLLILFNVVFSGFGAYLLTIWLLQKGIPQEKRLGSSQYVHWAALIAATIYAFASNRMIYLALGHYNIQSWVFLPYFVLYLMRTVTRPSRHNAILAGVFGAFNLLVDMQYGVFMAFFGVCLLLARPLRDYLFTRPIPFRRWFALTFSGIIAILLTLPYFLETIQSMLHAGYLIQGWGDALKLSADLAGWLTPTALHPLWGTDWPARLRAVQEGTAPFNDVNTVFLGFVTTGLAFIGGVFLWKRARGWVIAATLSALFTLGPLLQIYGKIVYNFDGLTTSIPMPFIILHYIPFVKGNRTANRWSIVLMLALAVLAAWGAFWLINKLDWKRNHSRIAPLLSMLLVALILFEHAAMPLPTTDARIPDAVQQLAELPEGAVWQIPMGWRNSFGVLGVERTQAQYYMTAHRKPIISGNTSRNPSIKFDYFARLPLVAAIAQAQAGHPIPDELWTAATSQAEDVITLWNVRYLMLMPPVPGRLPYADTWQASQNTALKLIPHSNQPIIDDGRIQIFEVQPGEPLPLKLDFGAENTDLWRAEGWDSDEPDVGGANGVWAIARRTHLLFRSKDTTPRQIRFRTAPFTWPNAPEQILTLQLNGKTLSKIAMSPGWQEYEFTISPKPGINHLWFEFSRADSPRDKLRQAVIGTTGVQSPVNISIHAFDQAFMTLTDASGNVIDASFGRRGYNVTLISTTTGEVLDKQGFDTVANAYEVERLVNYLNGLPDGQIVLLATREGAGAFVSPELISALRRLGSAVTTPDNLINQAHALVGVTGTQPGAAAETIAAQDAYLEVSGDFRTLAAAFDWLEIK